MRDDGGGVDAVDDGEEDSTDEATRDMIAPPVTESHAEHVTDPIPPARLWNTIFVARKIKYSHVK